MNLIYLDLSPAYIPFLVQCTKAAGDKIDPTVDNLIIYEEGGADAAFDATTISGSPFDPAKVNAKTGLWGVLVPKSALTAGRWYIALWEMTVDGVTTAKVERYFACNHGTAQTGDVYAIANSGTHGNAALKTLIDDVPTVTEFNARSTADPATAASQTAIAAYVDELESRLTAARAAKLDAITEARLAELDPTGLPADVAAVAGYIDTEVAAIKAKTDNLPASPAATGDIPSAAAIADAVWDEAMAGHLGVGSTGEKLNGASAPSAASVADAVWDEALAGHLGVGSTGEALNAAGAAGDPWTTQLPGAYGAGSAGKIVGDNVNAPIATIDTVVDEIKAKTDNLPSDPADQSLIINATDALLARLGVPAGASVSADVAAVKGDTAAIKAKTDNLTSGVKRNVALNNFTFPMVDANGIAVTGLVITAQRSIDGASFASCANSVVEIGNGVYKINLAASDLNGLTIALKFTASGTRQRDYTIITET